MQPSGCLKQWFTIVLVAVAGALTGVSSPWILSVNYRVAVLYSGRSVAQVFEWLGEGLARLKRTPAGAAH